MNAFAKVCVRAQIIPFWVAGLYIIHLASHGGLSSLSCNIQPDLLEIEKPTFAMAAAPASSLMLLYSLKHLSS